eukprot:TRINITY_DN38459_c0_g1_i1.p1 TRINITY_DN38459_c0_g1~~TRINITY_DN38459_c0_g1_i1.p1  ORF type:complete len:592 (+),score=104.30 TRINITY_DN38459_c0_g1_i1:71-1777(+)
MGGVRCWRLSPLLLLLLARGAVAGDDADEAADATPEFQFEDFTFRPGKVGLKADWRAGSVSSVDKGGQAGKLGVKAGWLFHQVDGEPYSEKRLDKRIGGKSDYVITFKRKVEEQDTASFDVDDKVKEDPLSSKDSINDYLTAIPQFVHATELDVDSFEESVRAVTNRTNEGGGALADSYFPVVFFHVSWCKHCKNTMPEYEQAAKMLSEGEQQHFVKTPKLFLIQCDLDSRTKALCAGYIGESFPSIVVFRDRRMVRFNRPRVANTIAWWVSHVSRPAVYTITQKQHLDHLSQYNPVFVLKADAKKDKEMFAAWSEVALDNLDGMQFVHVTPDTNFVNGLKTSPAVTVTGPGLEPLAYTGGPDPKALATWAHFNQFQVVTALNAYTAGPLKSSGHPVVTILYDNTVSAAVLEQFKAKAHELRDHGFLFCSAKVDEDKNGQYIEYDFPLLTPGFVSMPRTFVFKGEVYWESNEWRTPDVISLESLQSLLNSGYLNMQDDTEYLSWFIGKFKYIRRYASSGPKGAMVVLLVGCLVARWMKKMFGKRENTEPAENAVEDKKGNKKEKKKDK